ncbi:hypothetical protein GCM10010211_55570 [Streptomyces albospinus]|uniref:Uncharacterized protein n=1 Tax=Streptomyces albospinus TaxID=285515 RepID=A0ABQ2VG90_9ACTN|nr:hypothetical protein GCM10010211_55570 [Streptomyces albospinus]
MNVVAYLPADPQAAEPAHMGERTFRDPALGAQAGAVPRATAGDQRLHTEAPDQTAVLVVVVAAVGKHDASSPSACAQAAEAAVAVLAEGSGGVPCRVGKPGFGCLVTHEAGGEELRRSRRRDRPWLRPPSGVRKRIATTPSPHHPCSPLPDGHSRPLWIQRLTHTEHVHTTIRSVLNHYERRPGLAAQGPSATR